MARKRFKPEEIIHKLREAEVKLAAGSTTPEVCRALGYKPPAPQTKQSRTNSITNEDVLKSKSMALSL